MIKMKSWKNAFDTWKNFCPFYKRDLITKQQMVSFASNVGIISSRLGITGRTQDLGARHVIRDYAVQGKTILILDTKDLEEISNGLDPLLALKCVYCRMYFKNMKI